jgi:hypothetical protein
MHEEPSSLTAGSGAYYDRSIDDEVVYEGDSRFADWLFSVMEDRHRPAGARVMGWHRFPLIALCLCYSIAPHQGPEGTFSFFLRGAAQSRG